MAFDAPLAGDVFGAFADELAGQGRAVKGRRRRRAAGRLRARDPALRGRCARVARDRAVREPSALSMAGVPPEQTSGGYPHPLTVHDDGTARAASDPGITHRPGAPAAAPKAALCAQSGRPRAARRRTCRRPRPACRYMARPPIPQDRLAWREDGMLVLRDLRPSSQATRASSRRRPTPRPPRRRSPQAPQEQALGGPAHAHELRP